MSSNYLMKHAKKVCSSVISRRTSLQQQRLNREISLAARRTSQSRFRRNVTVKCAPSNSGCETLILLSFFAQVYGTINMPLLL